MPFIYKIINDINDKIYIGKSTISLEDRLNQHFQDSKKSRMEKRPLYNAMNKYGIHHFQIELVEECDLSVLSDREIYWIDYYNSYYTGYNATKGGDGKLLLDYDLLVQTYLKEKDMITTAKICNCHKDSVKKALIMYNIPINDSDNILKERNSKKCVMIKDNNIIETFNSVMEAATYVFQHGYSSSKNIKGIQSHIIQVCNKQRNTAYGFKWRYK